MRKALRIVLAPAVVAAIATPAAQAAGGSSPTATTASTTPQFQLGTPQQPAQPGGAFGPLQNNAPPPSATQPTVTATKRAGDTGNGRGTLLFLSIVALGMIGAVGVFIWYEGAKKRTSVAKRRRSRMRAGRPAQAAASMSAGDRRSGPPPPPRKRRAAAKKRKR